MINNNLKCIYHVFIFASVAIAFDKINLIPVINKILYKRGFETYAPTDPVYAKLSFTLDYNGVAFS